MVMTTQVYKCIKTLQTVQLKYVNFIVYKSYIIKAVFLKRQRDTYPPSAYRKTVGIKQNGPVKRFKGMLALSCKCFLCWLQVNSIVIYEPPTRRPGLKVAREELGEKGMTKITLQEGLVGEADYSEVFQRRLLEVSSFFY